MKKLLLASCLSIAFDAYAVTLTEALSKAYNENRDLKSVQEEYIKAIQDYPRALSQGFLPNVDSSTSITSSKDKSSPNARQKVYKQNFTISQNIFAGGSSVASLAATKYSIDSSKISYIQKEQKFLLDSIMAYVNYIKAKEALDASRAYVNAVSENYDAVSEKLKVGEATQTEVAAALAKKAQAQAGEAEAEANFLTQTSYFNTVFGVDPENVTMPEAPVDLPATYEEYEKLALRNNLELRNADASLKVQQHSLRASKGALLPKVQIEAGYSKQDGENELSRANNLGVTKGSRVYQSSLSMIIPIFSNGGAEYSRIRAAKADHRRAIYTKEYISKKIKTNLVNDWHNYVAAKQSVDYYAISLDAKKLEVEGIKSQYDVGLKTMLDVLSAELEYYKVVTESIEAKNNLIKQAYIIKSDLAQLNVKTLKLDAKPFDPDSEFRKTKFRVLGF